MAPIKFEENLKEKLEQRTINPSAKGWETLATRLEAKDAKKGISVTFWLSIAASIVGVLFAYNMLFSNGNSNIPSKNVVEIKTEIEEENILNKEEKNIEKEVIVEIKNETPILEEETPEKGSVQKQKNQVKNTYIVKRESKKEDLKIIKSEGISNKNSNNYYALNEIEKNIKSEVKKTSEKLNALAIKQTVVKEITDSELDALLKSAESKIVRTNTNNIVPLDYNELLQDVEDDLEETFRDKLLKTVKGGYHSVKTYVAERNE